MPTVREKYFELLKMQSPYINENVVRALLIEVNEFKNSTEMFLNMEKECKNLNILQDYVDKVLSGIPYQYVIHSSEFCGLDFYVDKNVLIPRNETEELVQEVVLKIKNLKKTDLRICDIGTGSGCIAISLNYILKCKVVATDISIEALNVAKKNNERLNCSVDFLLGNMAEPLIGLKKFDVLVSNPPYIPNVDTVDPQTLKHEPHLALFASPSTKYYEEIFKSVPLIMNDGALLAFEIGEDMEEELTKVVKHYFPSSIFSFKNDFYGKLRFLFINYKKEENMGLNLNIAKEKLENHGVIAIPTETVMGLACLFDDYDAYMRMNSIKRRPEDKPYSLMLSKVEDIEKYAYLNERSLKIAKAFLPGPLTLLLPIRESVPTWVSHNSPIVGIRIPENKIALELIDLCNKPLLVPSANRSGEKPAMSAKEVYNIFGDELDYIIDSDAEGGLPSTILDLTKDEYKIVREGPITLEMIEKVIKGE